MTDDGRALAFYNQDGIILRAGALGEDDGLVEVSFTFLDLAKRNDQLLISIAALHMVLTEDVGADFVFSSYTLQRVVMAAERLDRDVQERLVDAVVGIRARMGLVYRLADEHFYVDGNGGALHTSDDPALEPYRVTDGFGQAFVEAFSAEYRATTPGISAPP
jgi:hypothetical protein